ncbi:MULTISPECIES: hypothetical protein [Planktothrix]|jgi:hypothetical protein|uniref:Uncharacterized protein n=1 Tax=Planktothrix rubescens CCAP 1459/22 TaxID=329571 RepID=A0A6J7ZMF3_PLARU|nr:MULTISPECIES: hypothetical protein [Planktothrix]CAD5956129.1 Similar to tr/Q8YK90/Q8YK90 [Planktothrix rubescens]CAC5344003.1 conserved hypothetical protein [Planktothrix rubescens NIVA-CYA 18]CAD0226910.1 Similar to tr/Q8YK90/Q8YK90 [Planktothrix agardhii]CAD5910590.1 Similar to tr/Q8YK90/Q8YK90 [Planktothrix rubescens NIVA-CYA 18]CAD5913447.1 Similar to tr/Q8YK90/Q8YK90 [Planktothrix agardhii]
MQSIQFKGRIGKDGILRVQMPAEFKDRDLEAIVIFQAASENLKHENWQPGFFEEVIGGWVGEPLVRENQGQYEIRENLF